MDGIEGAQAVPQGALSGRPAFEVDNHEAVEEVTKPPQSRLAPDC
jgi:hypothetical protein